MDPKGEDFNFEIYEEPTLSRVTVEDAPRNTLFLISAISNSFRFILIFILACALREIPLKPTHASKLAESNSNGNALKPKSSYNCTPNQSFNDSFSDSLNLRRSTVRKIDNDFFDVSNTSINSSILNANPNTNANNAKPTPNTNSNADFVIFDENLTGGNSNFEVYNENKDPNPNASGSTFNASVSTFNGSRSSLSLSTTTASSGMLTPSRHSKSSVSNPFPLSQDKPLILHIHTQGLRLLRSHPFLTAKCKLLTHILPNIPLSPPSIIYRY